MGNEPILQNLKALAADPVINPKLIMRLPLISGVNDSEKDMKKVCRFFSGENRKCSGLPPMKESR
ncbi:MAG TPA: hypothetical protein VM577_20150 [Anaerovoracaceae bacterium]|nr:hypothetical protein [Anaerovoracaceae bacterium]